MTAPARSPSRRAARTPIAVAVSGAITVALVGACAGGPAHPSARSSAAAATTSTSSAPWSTSTTTPSAQPSTAAATPRPTATSSCGHRLAAAMTPAERAGQLLMVGLFRGSSPTHLAAQVRSEHLGGVLYLGGWTGGRAAVAQTSRELQDAASGSLLIAADQEGGQVQQLRGAGFAPMPSARAQGRTSVVAEERSVRAWSTELKEAGVTVNLAPVADTVPTSLGAANAPIGHYQRDFAPGNPMSNARYAAAFVRGTRAAGIAPTVKHFPGLGRIRGNTDVTASGITDGTTGPRDPYLAPFRAGIDAGAPLVMVSSARYPRLDPRNPAMFSHAIVSSLLRGSLGFRGVVITDDVGNVMALSGVPVGARATRFIGAGGDIVLTADARQAPTMLSAIAATRAAHPEFGRQVDVAAARVLDLKAALGLVRCT